MEQSLIHSSNAILQREPSYFKLAFDTEQQCYINFIRQTDINFLPKHRLISTFRSEKGRVGLQHKLLFPSKKQIQAKYIQSIGILTNSVNFIIGNSKNKNSLSVGFQEIQTTNIGHSSMMCISLIMQLLFALLDVILIMYLRITGSRDHGETGGDKFILF